MDHIHYEQQDDDTNYDGDDNNDIKLDESKKCTGEYAERQN